MTEQGWATLTGLRGIGSRLQRQGLNGLFVAAGTEMFKREFDQRRNHAMSSARN
jgi:hypothetical protein